MVLGQLGGQDGVPYSQVSQLSSGSVQVLLILCLSTHGAFRLDLVEVNLGKRIRELIGL